MPGKMAIEDRPRGWRAQGREQALKRSAESTSRSRTHASKMRSARSRKPLEDLDAQIESSSRALPSTIAQQLVRRELRIDPAQVIAIIRDTVALLPAAARDVRVHLHPDDAASCARSSRRPSGRASMGDRRRSADGARRLPRDHRHRADRRALRDAPQCQTMHDWCGRSAASGRAAPGSAGTAERANSQSRARLARSWRKQHGAVAQRSCRRRRSKARSPAWSG